MKYIYIENYLCTTRKKKYEFLKFINCFKKIKILKHRVVLNDNSLLIELTEDSSSKLAKKTIDNFYKDSVDVNSFFLDSLKIQESILYLFKEEKLIKSVKL